MAEPEGQEVVRPEPADSASVVRQVKCLNWAVAFVVFACLTVSVCLSVYLYAGNAQLKKLLARYERQLGTATEQARLLERLRLDFQQMSRTNKNAEALLRRYWPDARSRPTP